MIVRHLKELSTHFDTAPLDENEPGPSGGCTVPQAPNLLSEWCGVATSAALLGAVVSAYLSPSSRQVTVNIQSSRGRKFVRFGGWDELVGGVISRDGWRSLGCAGTIFNTLVGPGGLAKWSAIYERRYMDRYMYNKPQQDWFFPLAENWKSLPGESLILTHS